MRLGKAMRCRDNALFLLVKLLKFSHLSHRDIVQLSRPFANMIDTRVPRIFEYHYIAGGKTRAEKRVEK